MPRRRSHRLTVATTTAGLGGLALTLAACQAGPTDNGCLVTRQIVLGGTTPLPLAPEVRVDRVAPGPGDPVATFSGGAGDPPLIAMGTSASGMYAGAAWIDSQSGLPTYVMVDGQGQVVGGEPVALEDQLASSYTCLGFAPGKQELTVSYLRGTDDPMFGPSWLIDDIAADGTVSTLRLNVASANGVMSCARAALYNPPVAGASPEYAIAWQDTSGSWLSLYLGPELGMMVNSYPFASSTDFGGPDTQPPIAGLAAFGNDFGVLFARPHSVELWRLD